MRGFIGVLAVFAIILIYIESSSAIRCVECNNDYRQDCGDKFHLNNKTRGYIKDCGENVTTCRKIIQEVYIITDWENMKGEWNNRIIRQCAPTRGRLDCIERTGTYRVKVQHCHCDKDECNGSSHIQMSVVMILSSLLMSAGFLFSRYL